MPDVLFVCRANIFRSPLAEGLFKAYIKEERFPGDWKASSAGTWASGGAAAHPWVSQHLGEEGVSMDGHRSREVSEEMLARADLVLAMESGQAEALRAEFPEQADKIHMLSELKGERRDIEDPVGGSEADFREAVELIEYYIEGSEQRLKELAR